MLTMKFHKCLFVRIKYYYLYRNIIDVHTSMNYHVRSKLIIQHSILIFNCIMATWCIILQVYFKDPHIITMSIKFKLTANIRLLDTVEFETIKKKTFYK
jgi:hypothetical protein